MSDPAAIANTLTYMQRKTLRRLARGQTITRAMHQDPVVKTFYTMDLPEAPENPNVADWTDWESTLMNTRPQITEHGKQVHNALEGPQP